MQQTGWEVADNFMPKKSSTKKISKSTTSVDKKNTIFIQIAAYRDPQLVPTLEDCLAKAKHPENLRFCVAWQHTPEDTIPDHIKNDKRFSILDIPFSESKGACWARNQIQQKYNNEKYTLQLDSHHRFAQDWDQTIIGMLEDLHTKGFKKPLLTAYISSFDPDNDPAGRVTVPWKMNFDRFIPEGAVFFLPASMSEEEMKEPLKARFYSAHFCFADGSFCKEVPHDPEYYFHGEEISIAARAYTWGYDLFHPHKIVAWHEYTRKGRTKQWDDDKEWGKRNEHCHSRNRKLFGMDNEPQDVDFGIYGFGPVRTLRDYEKYAGLSFKRRAVQRYTLDHKSPPNPQYDNEEEFEKSLCSIFKHCIDVSYNDVPEKDYDFWAVAFHDKDGTTLHRKDVVEEEIAHMFTDQDKYCKIWREFQIDVKPAYWVVWPHSKSKGWCDKIQHNL